MVDVPKSTSMVVMLAAGMMLFSYLPPKKSIMVRVLYLRILTFGYGSNQVLSQAFCLLAQLCCEHSHMSTMLDVLVPLN